MDPTPAATIQLEVTDVNAILDFPQRHPIAASRIRSKNMPVSVIAVLVFNAPSPLDPNLPLRLRVVRLWISAASINFAAEGPTQPDKNAHLLIVAMD